MGILRITPLKTVRGYTELARYMGELGITDEILEINTKSLPSSAYAYSPTKILEWSTTLGSWIHRAETKHLHYKFNAVELS